MICPLSKKKLKIHPLGPEIGVSLFRESRGRGGVSLNVVKNN